jgi:hypothetical protein
MAPWPLEMEPKRHLYLSASASTWHWGVTPGPVACSELWLSGSTWPYLCKAESSCQIDGYKVGLLHSQAASHKQQQPGYLLLCHTGFLLLPNPLVSVCQHLHHCLHPMKATIKIEPREQGPAQLTIHKSVSCLHYCCLSVLTKHCSPCLDSRDDSSFLSNMDAPETGYNAEVGWSWDSWCCAPCVLEAIQTWPNTKVISIWSLHAHCPFLPIQGPTGDTAESHH